MSGLRSDMSDLYIPHMSGWGQICPVKLNLTLQKSRLVAKMMNLGPDKLITSKQDTIDHIEKKGTTRYNTNTRNHT
jgi:hypothetical protein